MKNFKRRFITLIEMMIVMFLIMLITGVIAFNMRGSLEKGKVFATKAGIKKVEQILNLAVAENPSSLDNIESQWESIVKESPMSDGGSALIKDGWGNKYEVRLENGEIVVSSGKFEEYKKSHPSEFEE
jgi:type II secretory pathway pseudopilin PulG